jgi:hypothetical protein
VSYLALSYLSCVLVFAACGPCAAVPVVPLGGGAEVFGGDVVGCVLDGDVGVDVPGLVGELDVGLDVGGVVLGRGEGLRRLGAGLDVGDGANVGWLEKLDRGEA